ncbi:MFS transporter [Streptomyces sp. PLAI1-29]|uniref:MFS transporter n=1 Tax=Streptomyces zingiberis TaxID=2053010 RepID=A0ABX1BVQ7_9ACTN|nr:MFS transporter [Streptomyces zingiberis]
MLGRFGRVLRFPFAAGGRRIRRATHAQGAGESGLGKLIELHAVNSAGDMLITIALASTVFFSVPTDQARGRVALYLAITMAPFALLAPVIGPILDRLPHGRRAAMAGAMLFRALLALALSGAVATGGLELYPAALGVLVASKAYGVVRSAVVPRLLPAQISLVKANSRVTLAGLLATGAAAPIGAGLQWFGLEWPLYGAFVIFVVGTFLSFSLPPKVDSAKGETAAEFFDHGRPHGWATDAGNAPPAAGTTPSSTWPADTAPPGVRAGADETRPGTGPDTPSGVPLGPPDRQDAARPPADPVPGPAPGSGATTGDGGVPAPGAPAAPGTPRKRPGLRSVGPSVRYGLQANTSLRALSGFLIFFLAFLLREEPLDGRSAAVSLGVVAVAAGTGNALGTVIGAWLKARAPEAIIATVLAIALVMTVMTAVLFSTPALALVAAVAGLAQALAKLSLDALIQRDVPERGRSSAFARSETLLQMAWVVGGAIGIALPLHGALGMSVAAALVAVGAATTVRGLLATARRGAPHPRAA